MATAGARGERTFQAGDREVTILFTNRALAGAEVRLGRTILDLLRVVQERQTVGIGDMAILIQTGMEAARVDARAGGQQVSLDEAYKVLDAVGLGASIGPVMEAVSAVLSYRAENGASPNGADPKV